MQVVEDGDEVAQGFLSQTYIFLLARTHKSYLREAIDHLVDGELDYIWIV